MNHEYSSLSSAQSAIDMQSETNWKKQMKCNLFVFLNKKLLNKNRKGGGAGVHVVCILVYRMKYLGVGGKVVHLRNVLVG